MKAIVYRKYGSSDVLELEEVEKPIPTDDEVLIKIHAASINDWDWALMRGEPFIMRLLGGLLKPKVTILGVDIAGEVEAVGKNVKGFQPGDAVFGDLSESGFGGFAEYTCALENALTLKPANMGFPEAAAIPHAAALAMQGLIDIGGIKQGQRLLINGAGGGVGTLGIQIAKLHGVAEVTGVDSSDKLDMLRSQGFDHVIDYRQEDFTRNGQQYDLILDVKTTRSPFDYARSLRTNGTYVTVGGSLPRVFQVLILAPLISRFNKKNLSVLALKPNKDLDHMIKLFAPGTIKPVMDGPYMLSEVPKAIEYFGEGKHKGKVIIALEHS